MGSRFRFKVPSCFFLGKLIQAMLTHGSQADALYRVAPGFEGITLMLFLPFEPPSVEPQQLFVKCMAVTFRGVVTSAKTLADSPPSK